MSDLVDPITTDFKNQVDEMKKLFTDVNYLKHTILIKGIDYKVENGIPYYMRPAYVKLRKLFRINIQIISKYWRDDIIGEKSLGFSYVVEVVGRMYNIEGKLIDEEEEVGSASYWEKKPKRTGLNDITGTAMTRAKKRVIECLTGCLFLSEEYINDDTKSKPDDKDKGRKKQSKKSESEEPKKPFFM